MKKKMLAISLAAVAAAGSAAAVDLPRVPAPYYYLPAPSIYNWAGFYTGLNLSYEWGKVTSSSVDPAGIAPSLWLHALAIACQFAARLKHRRCRQGTHVNGTFAQNSARPSSGHDQIYSLWTFAFFVRLDIEADPLSLIQSF
jgi:opacity protein-like surface antigen